MAKVSDLQRALSLEEIGLLAQCYGAGQRLFVPSSTAHAAHLEIILGIPATSALVHSFGGNYVYLPGLPKPDGRSRDPTLLVVKKLSSGPKRLSAAAIARLFRCSVRSIYGKRREVRRRERLGLPLTGRERRKSPTQKNARATNGQSPPKTVRRPDSGFQQLEGG